MTHEPPELLGGWATMVAALASDETQLHHVSWITVHEYCGAKPSLEVIVRMVSVLAEYLPHQFPRQHENDCIDAMRVAEAGGKGCYAYIETEQRPGVVVAFSDVSTAVLGRMMPEGARK